MFGDIIIGTTAAKELKEKYEDCHITYITGCKAFTETNPFIDKSFQLNLPKRFEKWFFQLLKVFYDEAYFLLHWLPSDNIVQSFMGSVGLEKKNYQLKLYLTEQDEQTAEAYFNALSLCNTKPFNIAIQADFQRKWNETEFSRLKSFLGEQYNLVFIGLGMKLNGKVLNFREAAAVIARCDLFVGGISGSMHAAVAVNVPTIATPNVFEASWDMPEYTQKEFTSNSTLRHRTVLPKAEAFCGHYAAVHRNDRLIFVDGDNYSPQKCFGQINRGLGHKVYPADSNTLYFKCRCSIKAEDVLELIEEFFCNSRG